MSKFLEQVNAEEVHEMPKPPTWKATEPERDCLDAIVQDVRYVEAKDSMVWDVLASTIVSEGERLEPGPYSVWETMVLADIREQHQLSPGDHVGIIYTGNSGNMKLFKVKVEKNSDSTESEGEKEEAVDDLPF